MKFLNGWLMINTGGDPTPDKLTVSVEARRSTWPPPTCPPISMASLSTTG